MIYADELQTDGLGLAALEIGIRKAAEKGHYSLVVTDLSPETRFVLQAHGFRLATAGSKTEIAW